MCNKLNAPLPEVTVVGAGLAGSEAAWILAEAGVNVDLYEMRPIVKTEAHRTALPAELVCSNSLGSDLPDRASGLLKEELRRMNSLLVRAAEETRVPAGAALAVDRDLFSKKVADALENHPQIRILRQELRDIPTDRPTLLAAGPLASPALSESLARLTGKENLFFFDAIAPVVSADSIDFTRAFRASRYDRDGSGDGDYINCPFTREEYETFIAALLSAERIPLRSFEEAIRSGVRIGRGPFFEGCLPIEVLAERGKDALAFGPLRPVGLIDPRTGKRPWACLQLRQDNRNGSAYNLVGFQTNLKYPEQKRVFRTIPGLENAEFLRYGEMHRNTFIAAAGVLNRGLQLIRYPNVFIAGQLAGVEGYMGNIAFGHVAARNMVRYLRNEPPVDWPEETMIGALLKAVTGNDTDDIQPVKANFGILPELDAAIRSKKERAAQHVARALERYETDPFWDR